MAELLVLSLTETTRQKNGYEIIAKNLDDDTWVIIPALPKDLMFNDQGEAQWDILAVTKADIKIRLYENRSGVYDVSSKNYFPEMINQPIIDNNKRIEILDNISNLDIDEIDESDQWVGVLKNPNIKDIIFRTRKENEIDYDYEKTFYWECRVEFNDVLGKEISYGNNIGTVCKDLRFKSYWKDIKNRRTDKFGQCKEKWINYMNSNNTYFVIEYIPNQYYGSIGMVSGIICIGDGFEKNEHI